MLPKSLPMMDKLQAGFTLLEILVSLIVVTIGLLGLAGLQMTGLRHNHDTYLRSQAALQAYDIIDRMRANNVLQANGTIEAAQPNTLYDSRNNTYTYAQIGAANAHSNCENAAGCNSSDLAANDLFRWTQMLRTLLPSGIGIVCRDTSPDDGTYDQASDTMTPSCNSPNGITDPYVVKIWWVDDRTATVSRFVTVIGPVR